MTNRVLHDETLESKFRKSGFVTVDLFSPDEIAQIQAKFNSLKPDDGFNPPHKRYHCTFLDTNQQYKQECQVIFQDVAEKLKHVLYQFKFLSGNFYVKQPGGGEFPIHQNWDTVDKTRYTSVAVWIPLQDTNQFNGTLEFVEASHKITNNIATLNSPAYFEPFKSALKEKYFTACRLSAGQAAIFDDDIIHYSGVNSSTKPQVTLQLEFVPESAELFFYYVDPANPRNGIEVFEGSPEYFLNYNINNYSERPTNLKYLRTIPNHNKTIDEFEFNALMQKGDKIRDAFYRGKVYTPSFFDKLRELVGV